MVDAVDGGFLAVRHHDLVAKGVNGLEAKEFAGGLRDHPDTSIAQVSSAQAGARDEKDGVAVLRGQGVMRRGGAETDVGT